VSVAACMTMSKLQLEARRQLVVKLVQPLVRVSVPLWVPVMAQELYQ
jgi:hypothetical protein